MTRFNLLSFSGPMRTLHLAWFAFFLSFVVWFNHAPLMASIRDTFGLSNQQVTVLLILNVALAIPARIVIGMLVDAFGPRRLYALLLAIIGVLCFGFALAENYEQLALMRFLLGFAGASFVIGIRLLAEWFPARQVGKAEGIYGGIGNFGAAAAALVLPSVALAFGGPEGWRGAVMATGCAALVYAVVFFFTVRDTPAGSTYFKPKRIGALEVTSPGDFFLYLLLNVPLYVAMALLVWKLGPANLNLLNGSVTVLSYLVLAGLYLFQSVRVYQINGHVFRRPVPEIERYSLRQVAVLSIAYLVSFGSELAVVSMLPLFFRDTFDLSLLVAGALGGSYAVMCLFARPIGGLISDRFGRKPTLLLVTAGMSLGYWAMSEIDASWPLPLAVAAAMVCSAFVQAGTGATISCVPLIKRRLTGQIAGMAGAYGNVGGVLFLTVLSFVTPATFFLVIALSGVVTLAAVALFLKEPRGHMAEVLPDGTVQLIEVS